MAKWIEWNDKQRTIWNKWVASRPEVIQRMAARWPPDRLYQYQGQRVTLESYNEAGTVTVNITGQFNLMVYGRSVFGVDPEKLEECDLPGPDEPVGELTDDLEEAKAIYARLDATKRQRQSRTTKEDA